MSEKKITKREHFTAILEKYPLTEKEKDFIKHELELLDRKNAADKKPTAQQVANEDTKAVIIQVLTNAQELMTITDMMKSNAELGALSNQRISALLRQLIADGKVERIEDKRKAYFKLA